MKKYGLNKSDKLCSPTAIDKLFSRGASDLSPEVGAVSSLMAYPLRAVWGKDSSRQTGGNIQFLISIPKKRLRHAVDRVLMRRRVREAYRLNRHDYEIAGNSFINLAFVYVANELKDYQSVEKAVCRILKIISEENVSEG